MNASFEESLPEQFPNPAGGYASMVPFIPGQGVTYVPHHQMRATEGIFHPRGVSQYANNAMSVPGNVNAYKQNQTYDLVDNNEATGQCRYRYYVLRIPANLQAVGGIDI